MPRGGARPGAGRKPRALKVARKVMAAEVLGAVDETLLWQDLLHSDDERIRLDALRYLTDRRDGKAMQSMSVSGAEGIPQYSSPRLVVNFVATSPLHVLDATR